MKIEQVKKISAIVGENLQEWTTEVVQTNNGEAGGDIFLYGNYMIRKKDRSGKNLPVTNDDILFLENRIVKEKGLQIPKRSYDHSMGTVYDLCSRSSMD